MLLPVTGQQELFRHRIAVEAQRPIFFQNLPCRYAVLKRSSSLRASSRKSPYAIDGSGMLNALINRAAILLAQRVARQCIFQLSHHADIARAQFRYWLQRLAEWSRNMRQPLIHVRPRVVQMRIVFELSCDDFAENVTRARR